MADSLVLRAGDAVSLASYVGRQLHNMFPCGELRDDIDQLAELVPVALERMRPILATVRNFEPERFDHLHTLQYATFLYLLGNERWVAVGNVRGDLLADRLYALNRSVNSIDLFYSVAMPEIFFLSHALGAVLGNARYATGLVVFQGVTVGRVGDDRPEIGANVVLYPGAQVSGAAHVGDGCVIGAGTLVHGGMVPADSVVLRDADGRQFVKPRRKDYSSLYFRHEHRPMRAR